MRDCPWVFPLDLPASLQPSLCGASAGEGELTLVYATVHARVTVCSANGVRACNNIFTAIRLRSAAATATALSPACARLGGYQVPQLPSRAARAQVKMDASVRGGCGCAVSAWKAWQVAK
eukprot:TRINITY_DN13709_c0_g1_i1.p5 TRINITY_DN13709_c0_g1~~TRINITY_DN13709_c0_g1_i1.p5  ORF type:complete len:120 (-),score=10.78 TRINITY_DN13709_c0_g1_i1:140-499(-)